MRNVEAAQAATELLLKAGRRRIALVGAHVDEDVGSAALRTQGYEQALAAAGIEVDQSLVRYTTLWHRSNGAEAIRDLLSDGVEFDAVFGLNDALALGAMRALQEAGLRIPDDVSVVASMTSTRPSTRSEPVDDRPRSGADRPLSPWSCSSPASVTAPVGRPTPARCWSTSRWSYANPPSRRTDPGRDTGAERADVSDRPAPCFTPASLPCHWMPSLMRRHSWHAAPVGPHCCATAPSAVEHEPISRSFALFALAMVQ